MCSVGVIKPIRRDVYGQEKNEGENAKAISELSKDSKKYRSANR